MLMSMRYRLVRSLIRLLLRCGVDEQDLETAVLRHQLKVLRRGGTRPRFTDADRAFLAAAAGFLSRDRWRSFLVGPDTLLRWHRELSRRRRGRRSRRPGRPPLDPSIKSLILRLGRENPRWGYLRIRGELLKLGVDVSAPTIATVLRRSGLGPAPRRIGPTWTQFLMLQAYGLLSPGAPSEENEGPEELVAIPHRPLSDGPATADEPIRAVPSYGWTSHLDGGRPPPMRPRRQFRRAPELGLATGPRSPPESFWERKGRQPPIGLSFPCPVVSTGRLQDQMTIDPALARGE